jgi:hypothetical protein
MREHILVIDTVAEELGVTCQYDRLVAPGDFYLASSLDKGVHFLQCLKLGGFGTIVFPIEANLPFNQDRCVKVDFA